MPQIKKLTDEQLNNMLYYKREFSLSLFQCQLWLVRRYGISVSRSTIYERLQRLEDRQQHAIRGVG